MTTPFMEHPTGEFKSAVDAMADAIARLRALPRLEQPLDVDSIMRQAGVGQSNLIRAGANYSIASASPADAAKIIDAIFRHHSGIHPHEDEGDDYAVGAEWDGESAPKTTPPARTDSGGVIGFTRKLWGRADGR